jgi:chemotaxis family two-component system sensor kinase Cph1
MRNSKMPISLDGLTIMVVEDDFLAALDLKRLVEERAGKVAGPVGRLEQAQRLARSQELDGAILDVQLNGADSLPLADDLIARDIPVILVTGYDVATLPERFAETPRLPKPFSDASFDRLAAVLFVGDASAT